MVFTRTAALFSTLCSSLNSFAQNTPAPADSARRLGEVTVYATRFAEPAAQTGRSVTVIPGSAIGRYPVNSLDDLLRFLPALEVQSRGSFGAQADVSLRGSTFNQVLFLLDGMRLNDPLTGHFAGYLPITPAEIEQIEIVRGAGSALYGPDAVGGLVNIVTKTFAATRRADGAELASTTLRGEWNLWHTNTGGFAQRERRRVGGGVLLNTTDGQPREAPSTLRNDVSLKTYSLSAAYRLPGDRLSVAARAAFDRRDFNAQYFYTTSPLDLSRETTRRDWYQAQLRYEAPGGSQTELQAVYNRSADLYVFNPDPRFVPSNHRMGYFNAQLQHRQALGDKLQATAGGQLDRRAIDSNDRGNHATWHGGAFALLAAHGLRPGLALSGGLRLDYDQAYGTELTPQLNASQQVGEWLTLRASAGRAIRAADFTERYVSNNLPGPLSGGRNVGNPDLAAERTTSYEGGLDLRPLPRRAPGVVVKGTYFRRRGRNLIDYVSQTGAQIAEATGLTNLNPAATYRFAQNLFEVTTQGVETELTGAYALPAPGLRLDASVGYTYVRQAQGDQDVVSQYLANTARHLVSGNLTLRNRGGSVSLGGLYKKRDAAAAAAINRTLSAEYLVFNLRTEVAVLPEKVWLTGQILNLFDERYSDLLGAQMPGRWLMGGLRVAL